MSRDKVEDLALELVHALTTLLDFLFRGRLRACRSFGVQKYHSAIIVGNGPGLLKDISRLGNIEHSAIVACNFYLLDIQGPRPTHYVLLDDRYFGNDSALSLGDNQVERDLAEKIENLRLFFSRVDYPLILFVPANRLTIARTLYKSHYLNIVGINTVNIKGPKLLRDFMLDKRMGLPQPQTVLVASIFVAMQFADQLYLVGARASWIEHLRVSDVNVVSTSLFHEGGAVLEIIYDSMPDMLRTQIHLFEAFHELERFGKRNNKIILNNTKNSFIDAFTKR